LGLVGVVLMLWQVHDEIGGLAWQIGFVLQLDAPVDIAASVNVFPDRIGAQSELDVIAGDVPDPNRLPPGSLLHPRCAYSDSTRCERRSSRALPALAGNPGLLGLTVGSAAWSWSRSGGSARPSS